MFRIIARFPVRPEKKDEFTAIACELASESGKEDGVLSYTINISTEDPNLFGFFETYESKDAHTLHEKTPHFLRLFPQILERLSSDPVIEFFEGI